jgi:hypothetical protein
MTEVALSKAKDSAGKQHRLELDMIIMSYPRYVHPGSGEWG